MKEIIQQHIEKLLNHLEPLLPLANCHMVDFFTKDIFKKHINREILDEINRFPYKKIIQNIFDNDLKDTPVLKQYFDSCNKCMLINNEFICMNLNDFHEKMKNLGCKHVNGYRLKVFMTEKKSHEVEILSSIVAGVKEIGNTSHVIDFGDGKGYLSSMLALHHKIPVLGIDASPINSNAADKRLKKLSKAWPSLHQNPMKSVPKNKNSFTYNNDLYKQITKFVEPNTNINEIINNMFNVNTERISLSGLHTCGNLASTSLKVFVENDFVKTIVNVGCCYHLLNEKFEDKHHEHESIGFPMSTYLNDKKFCIGRNARMVAAQSVNRIFDKKELPDLSIFYRAVLQVFIERNYKDLPMKNVGKIKKKCDNFEEYTKVALKKLELNGDFSNNLNSLNDEFIERLDEINIFYLIRCMTAPIVESLILLDRLLYLHEKGYEKSFLVQLFNPVVSPRCYGIISIKE